MYTHTRMCIWLMGRRKLTNDSVECLDCVPGSFLCVHY